MKRTLPMVMLISLLLLLIPAASGEWNDISRLTFTGSAEQHTLMVDEDDTAHIVFMENSGGRTILRYMQLDSSGETTVPPETIITGPGDSLFPATALDSFGIHVVWWDSRSGSFNLYYTLLDHNGTRILHERSLGVEMAEDTSPVEAPQVDLDRFGNLYIVWSQQRKTSEELAEEETWAPSIYFAKVDWEGSVLVPSLRISSAYANAINPDIELDSSSVAHVVWSEDLTGNYEIYYTTVMDQDSHLDHEHTIIRLTDTPMESIQPSLIHHDGSLFMSWSDGDSEGDIFALHLARIMASGLTMNLVVSDSGNALYSQLAVSGHRIHMVWQDDRHSWNGGQGREAVDEMRDNVTQIYRYIKRHSQGDQGDQGLDASGDLTNWEIYTGVFDTQTIAIENETRLTSQPRGSITPKITTNSGGDIQIVWVDSSHSSGDLFYIDHTIEEIEKNEGIIEAKEGSLLVIGGLGILALIYLISGQGRRYAILRILILPLYTTISRDKLMENDNRKQIVELITSNEGITFTDLMDELGLKNGALAYHLYTLERRRYIKSVKDGKYRRFYPRGAKVTGLSSLEEKIITVIRTNPSISQREIATIIESTPQTVNYNIKKLIKRGVVYLNKEGKHTHCNLTNPNM
jgi:DNA-binding MarR family transcriptional regulator